MANELFNKQKVQQVNEYGRRKVAKCQLSPLINIYAKFYPELPGMGEAIRQLSMLLSNSSVVPQSELFCFKDKKIPYPVLLSQEVKGENLQMVLNAAYKENQADSKAKLNQLDASRWTDLFILTVLIHPEDGKPDNYILSPCKNAKGEDSYAIVAIDNGVCQESCRIKFKFLTLTEPIHADAPRPQFVDCHRSRRPGAPAQAVLFLA